MPAWRLGGWRLAAVALLGGRLAAHALFGGRDLDGFVQLLVDGLLDCLGLLAGVELNLHSFSGVVHESNDRVHQVFVGLGDGLADQSSREVVGITRGFHGRRILRDQR